MQLNSDTTISVRRAAERGSAEHGWLHARFTFSFANFYDPNHMAFGEDLRTGDGVAVENFTDNLNIVATTDSKFLLFRLA